MASSADLIEEEDWELLRNVGQLFKEIRLEAGLQQRPAAELLNTSQARITPLEKGQNDVFLTTLSRWARAYGYNLQINLIPIEDEFTKSLREAAEEIAAEGISSNATVA